MKIVGTLLMLLTLMGGWQRPAVGAWRGEGGYKPGAGPYEVGILRQEWFDRDRLREVPVKIYYPLRHGPCPVIIVSHGLGGTREGYEYLGRHWAGHGYVAIHLEHQGRNRPGGRDTWNPLTGLKRAVTIAISLNRVQDGRFALDFLDEVNQKADGPLYQQLDLARVGAAGHSYGAFTVQALAGQVFTGQQGRAMRCGHPRLKAGVLMSPSVPRDKTDLDKVFGPIHLPLLHLTGTRDQGIVTATQPQERRLPFDHIHGADQYLVNFTDGDHFIFSGRWEWRARGRQDARYQDLISMATTAFWDAYLKEEGEARRWLSQGGLQKLLGTGGTAEFKPGRPGFRPDPGTGIEGGGCRLEGSRGEPENP